MLRGVERTEKTSGIPSSELLLIITLGTLRTRTPSMLWAEILAICVSGREVFSHQLNFPFLRHIKLQVLHRKL